MPAPSSDVTGTAFRYHSYLERRRAGRRTEYAGRIENPRDLTDEELWAELGRRAEVRGLRFAVENMYPVRMAGRQFVPYVPGSEVKKLVHERESA